MNIPKHSITFKEFGSKRIDLKRNNLGYGLYNSSEVEQIEDSLITGVLRDSLPDVKVGIFFLFLDVGLNSPFHGLLGRDLTVPY